MLLYGYLEIDQLLTELIENVHDADTEEYSLALINKFVGNATAEDLDNKRELLLDSFLDFLPKQDDAGTNLSIYEHGYAYTTLYEFINKCIYHLQDQDAEPPYLKGLTPDQKQIVLSMKSRGEVPKEYTELVESMRVGNTQKKQLYAMA